MCGHQPNDLIRLRERLYNHNKIHKNSGLNVHTTCFFFRLSKKKRTLDSSRSFLQKKSKKNSGISMVACLFCTRFCLCTIRSMVFDCIYRVKFVLLRRREWHVDQQTHMFYKLIDGAPPTLHRCAVDEPPRQCFMV